MERFASSAVLVRMNIWITKKPYKSSPSSCKGVVKVDVDLPDAHPLEDELSLLRQVAWVRIPRHLQFHTPHEKVGA